MSVLTFDGLWAHQKKAVELARSKRDLALFFQTGTGKTATLIYILREEYQRHLAIKNTLIFAPLSVCAQWKKEFAKFSQIPPDAIHVLTGPGKERAATMAEINAKKKPCIVVTNYEAVQGKPFYAQLLKWCPEIVVADECHRIKDSSSVRAKAIYCLTSAARRRFILTGTPILNSMLDIFGQFKALDPTIFGGNFFEFKRRYFYDMNAHMPRHVHFPNWQPLPTTAKQLGEVIGRASVQAKKADCIDLPPLLKIPVSVELSPEQRRTYDSMAKEFVAEMQGSVVAAEFSMVKTLRLQQILAGFIVPDGDDAQAVWCKDNPRLSALKDILESINGEKVIVWSVFKPTYQAIARVCEEMKLSHAFVTGEQSIGQKQRAIEDFCAGSTQVMIANPASGGVGLNLIEAKYAIYYTRGYSLEQFIQSEARNFRAGSNMHSKVTHFHIQAADTLDEVIATALLNKQNVSDAVMAWAKKS